MIAQMGIAAFGVLAIWLSQSNQESQRKWACIAGLCSQPFWFWSAYAAEQWGIFALCFLYAISWFRGFVHYWVLKRG